MDAPEEVMDTLGSGGTVTVWRNNQVCAVYVHVGIEC